MFDLALKLSLVPAVPTPKLILESWLLSAINHKVALFLVNEW